ncbi:MAG: DUF927 domain-containing protein [Spirochaetes bacterium]|nr:DUF927 domain-containing protein [Spirochaetota bacterium]
MDKNKNMDNTYEEFIFKENKLNLTISKTSIISYIDISLRGQFDEISQAVYNKYNIQLVIYETFKGLIIPKQFRFTSNGIETIRVINDDKREQITISNKWIYVESKVYSKYHGIYQYEVTAYDPITKKYQRSLCIASTLGRYYQCINFCMDNLNIVTNENYKKELIDYFNKFLLMNNTTIKKKETLPRLGWNDNCTEFLPYSENMAFDFTNDKSRYLKGIFDSFKKKGSKTKYLEKIKEFTTDNSDAEFIIGCSFAAPLLKPLSLRSYALNFYGDSGSYKSLACKLAMSIWGNPDKLYSAGNHTSNVIIEKLAKFHNLPFYIDEITENSLDIYQTGNESGRHRLTQQGEIKEAISWRTVLFSTSEISMDSENKKHGEINRFLSFKVNCVPSFVNNKDEYARELYSFISNNYGLLGNDFINYVIIHKIKINDLYKEIYKRIYNSNINNQHLSMIACGYLGLYLYRYIFLNIDDLEYVINRDKKIIPKIKSIQELDPIRKMYRTIVEFYEINKSAFMVNGIPQKTNYCYGMIKDNKVFYYLGPLKKYLSDNGFNWNEKRLLIESNLIEYKNYRINNEVGKRIIIDLNSDFNYEEIEREGIEDDES